MFAVGRRAGMVAAAPRRAARGSIFACVPVAAMALYGAVLLGPGLARNGPPAEAESAGSAVRSGVITARTGHPASATTGHISAGEIAGHSLAQPDGGDLTGQVVVFGVPGLRWSDISPQGTPTIWQLLDEGSAAAMSVRTVRQYTCPSDGWLTLGAGARATAPRTDGECTPLSAPAPQPSGAATVPGFERIVEANAEYSYDPQFGLLATEVERAGGCVTAAGPGAALAVANEGGQVQRYVADLSALGPEGAVSACAVTLVDLGSAPDDPAARTRFLADTDAQIGRIGSGLSPDTTLIVAGISDRSSRPHLGALILTGPQYTGGWLDAASTRQPGLVQLTDLAPTILDLVGLPSADAMVGAATRPADGRPADTATAWQRLAQQDVAAQTIRDYAGIFFMLLELGQVLLYAIIGWLVWRGRRGRSATSDGRLGRALYVGGLFVGSAPAASFLANLAPWWRVVHPAPLLGGLVLGWTVLITVCALAGPWRRWHLLGPAGFVACLTFVTLAADVTVGASSLQLSSLYGLSPLIAGRFYGFGNVAFAVFAMAALFTALAAAAFWLGRERRRPALIAVTGVAVVAVLVDGWPTWGADFGGVLAMVPGFAVLGMSVAGLRPSAARLAAIAAGALVAVSAIAFLDWLRPADDRSHLGRFVQRILDGEAGDIVQRKFDATVATFTRGPEGVVVPILLVLVAYLLIRPERLRTFDLAVSRVPILRPGLVGMYVTAVLGFAVNDSGIQVSAVCLTVATPLVVATCARLLTSPADQPPVEPAVDVRA